MQPPSWNRYGRALIAGCFLAYCALPAYSQPPGDVSLEGTWSVRLTKPDGSVKPVTWEFKPSGDGYQVLDGAFTFTFTAHPHPDAGAEYDFTCELQHVGKIGQGLCSLAEDGHLTGEMIEEGHSRPVFTATRTDHSDQLPKGLYLEAGKADVRRGQYVSIPIYLRYNGPMGSEHEQLPANMNFEMTYDASVAQVRSHPQRERNSPSVNTKEAPELPRGNLVDRGVLLAGNTRRQGIVKVGLAGKKGIKPGTGRAGETLTEIYFQAVGMPGQQTELELTVTMINDCDGKKIPISTVCGRIRILDNSPLQTPPCGSGPDMPVHTPKALDAYKALLMSIGRMTVDLFLDVTKDSQVTSLDAAKILQMAGQTSGETPGGRDCSGGHSGGVAGGPPGKQGMAGGPGGPPVPPMPPADPGGPTHPPMGPSLTPLDAYKALLMSVTRLEIDPKYDLSGDTQVTSRDSVMILEASRRAIGE